MTLLHWRVSRRMTSVAWWLTFIFLALVFAVHFSLVQMANLPLSPFQLKFNRGIYYWVHPYFTQRWSFFAPSPPDQNHLLLARGKYTAPGGEVVTTDWVDVSTPFYEAVSRNRLTPLFLVEIGMSNALTEYVNYLGTNPGNIFGKDGKGAITQPLPANLDTLDVQYLTRHAAATLKVFHPELNFSEIELGVLTTHYPRFPDRHQEGWTDMTPSMFEIQWQPFPVVDPFQLNVAPSSKENPRS